MALTSALPRIDVISRKRVLCATDLQPRSDIAVERAALLARRMHARLMLLHVVDSRQSWRAVRAATNRAYVQMLAKVDEIFGHDAASVDIAVRAGEPFDVISNVADEQNAQLLVIAAFQARRFDAVLGTTAERLIRITKRPLLIARGPAADRYRSVIVGTDGSRASVAMLQTAAGLRVLDDAHVTVMHAFRPPYEAVLRSAGVQQAELQGYRRGWREQLRSDVRAHLTAAGLDANRVRVLVPPDEPLTAIHSLIDSRERQLLVIGASRWFALKRLLVGSVADGVLRSVDTDVLVIPLLRSDSRRPARREPGSDTTQPAPAESM